MKRYSSKSRAIFQAVSLFAVCRLVPIIGVSAESSKECERLAASLTYTQEEAPRDLSSVVRIGSGSNFKDEKNDAQFLFLTILFFSLVDHWIRFPPFFLDEFQSIISVSFQLWSKKSTVC